MKQRLHQRATRSARGSLGDTSRSMAAVVVDENERIERRYRWKGSALRLTVNLLAGSLLLYMTECLSGKP